MSGRCRRAGCVGTAGSRPRHLRDLAGDYCAELVRGVPMGLGLGRGGHGFIFGAGESAVLDQLQTGLGWEGKYDEYGNRRTVDVAGLVMPMQRIETIDEPRTRAAAQGDLFDSGKAHQDDFRNLLIWGDNLLTMASLLKDFKGKI